MKRIGMVLDNPYTGDNRVMNEARFLSKSGFEVYVLALNYGQHAPIEDLDGVRIRRIPVPEKVKNYLFAFYHWLPLYNRFWKNHLDLFVQDFGIEAIHAHDLYMAESCAAIAKKYSLPMVLDLHENYPAAVRNYQWTQNFPGNLIARIGRWKTIEGRLLQSAQRIIVLSEHYRDQLCKQYPQLNPNHFAVYPNVPDHEKLLGYPVGENPLPHPESHWLFYFGVIAERRGVYTAIDAVKQLRNDGHDVRLLLAGNVNNAEKNTFNERINAPEVREFILHKPWIDISEFPTYAAACTAGLSPIFSGDQHDIGVANKVFQYMLLELPVIASESAAQAEIVEKNNCGIIHDDRNVQSLAAATEQLIRDTDLRVKLGSNGKKAVMEKYNLKSMGPVLTELYHLISDT